MEIETSETHEVASKEELVALEREMRELHESMREEKSHEKMADLQAALEEVKNKIEHFTEESRRYLDEKIDTYERITREGFDGIRAELAVLAHAEEMEEDMEEEASEGVPPAGVVMIETPPETDEEGEDEAGEEEAPTVRRKGFFVL